MDLLVEQREAIAARLLALGWIAADESVTALAPAGAGNMNRTLRIELSARSIILKQAVPFVARFPEIAAPIERLDTEIAFYRLISADAALAMRTPAVLGTDPSNHLICLEDLGTGGDLTWLYAGNVASDPRGAGLRGQLTALFYWLWRLHALNVGRATARAGLETVPDNRAMRLLNHAHIFEIPFDTGNGVALAPALAALQRALADDTVLRDHAAALGRIYLGEAHHDSRPALLHGDFYPGSWLAHPRLGVMVIDPEFAFVGAPEFDVGVLLAHLIMAGFGQLEVGMQLRSYVTPPGFSQPLALGFAGMEIIRRLLGVAQLPLAADPDTRLAWLETARQLVSTLEVPAG